jgi:hypothetical protein
MSDLLIGLEKAETKKPSERVEELAPTPEDEAMDEFFDAYKSGDNKAAKAALKSVIRICSMQNDYSNDGED